MISPVEFMKYARSKGGWTKNAPPQGLIFCYDRKLMDYICSKHKTRKIEWYGGGDMRFLNDTDNKVAVLGRFGIGAPVASILLEEAIAWGIKRFISIGTAGTLQKDVDIGDLVVCDKAVRDEGTSHHYLKPSKYACASGKMTRRIISVLKEMKLPHTVGTSWTIDAPYRETVAEARQYQKEGVLTVEMEAAALFAVAHYRKIELGSLFTISDSLAELEWKPEFHSKKTQQGLETIYQAALKSLL